MGKTFPVNRSESYTTESRRNHTTESVCPVFLGESIVNRALVVAALIALASAAPAADLLPADRPIPEVIDHYVNAKLKQVGVAPAPQCDEATLGAPAHSRFGWTHSDPRRGSRLYRLERLR